ncbi:BB_0208 family protein [Borrelia hispanica]|uniref:BB_0208 family protein n=1 Tax=Borrelia hispanica TaxID=40835 RepID=UPI000464EC0B|nr:BB_0208 family protein [Borrelia hispanica]
MTILTKYQKFYDTLEILKKYINTNVEEKILKYSILSKLYKLNEKEIINLITISKNYELKKNILNITLEEYYYEEAQDNNIKNWILEIIKEKNLLQIKKETNLISKRPGITYKLNSSNFLKIIEISNNNQYTKEKKELYKQLILNFSNNLKIENLEPTIDILIAVKYRNKEKIKRILKDNLSFQRLFKSSLSQKQNRVTKLKKLLILTYWPVGCLSKSLFNKILTKNYKYIIDEVLTLKYDEILKYLKTIKTFSLNEIFYKGSNKNSNFNYFFSEFTRYTPKDFQNTFKTYLFSLEKTAIKQYLKWFFKDKVPHEWKDFIFTIEYIDTYKLLNIDTNIEDMITAKFQAEEFFISFEKMNFNPYESSKIFQNKKIRRIFLIKVMNYIKKHITKIDTYGWISFYIYADKNDRIQTEKDIKQFFKNKNFEIQNQIFVYFLSFYPNIDQKHFEFISEIMIYLDSNKITIPQEIIQMQKTSPHKFNYCKSYIFVKSLTLRTRVFKILNKNIKLELLFQLEEFQKKISLLPAIYYIVYYYKLDALREEQKISPKQKEEIINFITFLNQEQNKFDSKTP